MSAPLSSGPSFEVEALVAEVAWVRRLALALVRDQNVAEDVAQDAFAAALRHRPDARRPLRAWFERVVRNLVRLRAREQARRGAREELAGAPEPADDPVLALGRLETQEALLRSVRELDEPYRTVVLLRYFEGLEPVEIARRRGLSVRTVHTQLTRALEKLRARLDNPARGGRAGWMSVWIPLLGPAEPLPWILAMDAKLKLALSGALCAGLLCWWWLLPATPKAGAPVLEGSAGTPATLSAPEAEALAASNELPGAARAAQDPAAAPKSAPSVAPGARITGRVVDARGAPLALPLMFVAANHDAQAGFELESDARGRFDVPAPSADGTLAPRDEHFTAVLEPRIAAPFHTDDYVLVVAPRIALAGHVLDQRGRPVDDAKVELSPPSLRGTIDLILDASANRAWRTRTDEHGAFELPEVPALEHSALWVEATGFVRARMDAPLVTERALEIVLQPVDAADHLLGRVVDALGHPVEGAYVALERQAMRTDRAGRFDLTLQAEGESDSPGNRLRVVKAGYLPVMLACAKESPRAPGAWPDPLVLTLAEPALSIAGRVVDAEGQGVPHAQLLPLERTHFADVETPFGAHTFYLGRDVESLMAGSDWKSNTEADAEGRFELRGLLARDYRLRVFHPGSLRLFVSAPLAAGQRDVRLVLPAEEFHARIAGTVVDHRGAPVRGASVQLLRDGGELEAQESYDLLSGKVEVGADGRFEFRGVSKGVRSIQVYPPGGVLMRLHELKDERDLEHLTLEVELIGHVRIESAREELEGTSFGMLDEQGEALTLYSNLADVSAGGRRFGFEGGKSDTLTVSERARELVFWGKDGKELLRLPVTIAPGSAIQVLRP